MKYFLDTEFIETPNTITLISIGIVSDYGDVFYAESANFDIRQCNEWVLKNVIPNLKWRHEHELYTTNNNKVYKAKGFNNCMTHMIDTGIVTECFGENSFIGGCVRRFVEETCNSEKIEFYGYYADYDWVVFCRLFGKMIDLPDGFPMYCKNIKQMMDEKGNPQKPNQCGSEHNALEDAIYHKRLYKWITSQ